MTEEGYHINFKGEEMVLLPSKAIWFPSYQTILVSDTHIGKSSHFRKSGIAIPKAIEQEDLAHLSDIIENYHPVNLIFLGDLFHSDINDDWNWFSLWRQLHNKINMILVKGNHDILPKRFYENCNLRVINNYVIGNFKLYHDLPKNEENFYIISGHIHPGIHLHGKARQGITVPCFWFGEKHAIMPAFGKFTGKAILKPSLEDKVFAIAGKKIISL